ncbi:MAG: L-arabinose isomerase, partial [Lentisphaeria bacterium]|nr:L-arabinose isomerase [Lentisphaeria bacterium]
MAARGLCDYAALEVWFLTGSQHLYGEDVLRQVAADSQGIVEGLNASGALPIRLVFQPVLTTPEAISQALGEADRAANCIGLVTWMHTFSPAKMWIAGLTRLHKPFCHLHTQYNRDIPWDSIDMDFMNLNQSAHGDREFGFICSRLRLNRKVVVGHWQENGVRQRLGVWMRAAAAWHDAQGMRVARIGDNMRQVAVTEGDKVEAERVLGYTVDGFGMGDVVRYVHAVTEAEIEALCRTYDETYALAPALRPAGSRRDSLREAA